LQFLKVKHKELGMGDGQALVENLSLFKLPRPSIPRHCGIKSSSALPQSIEIPRQARNDGVGISASKLGEIRERLFEMEMVLRKC